MFHWTTLHQDHMEAVEERQKTNVRAFDKSHRRFWW